MSVPVRVRTGRRRPLKNVQFCSITRKAKILTTPEKWALHFTGKARIHWVFWGLKFEPVDKSRLSGTQKLGKKGHFAKVSIYGALTIWPDFIQLVQTFIFLTLPLYTVRTLWRFGLNRRFVTLWAWLILFPTSGFFPHISHTFDILSSISYNSAKPYYSKIFGQRKLFLINYCYRN